MTDELHAEVCKIRSAYPWLQEETILRYAEQCVKNRHGKTDETKND